MMNDEGRPWDILERTKTFALRIIRLFGALPKTTEARVIGRQILRSGTSVGAQLREGKRSRSDAEMISKTESALQELEETAYWLELLAESEMVEADKLTGSEGRNRATNGNTGYVSQDSQVPRIQAVISR